MTEQEGTKGHPGAFDAYQTARPDEPVFTLQGGDPNSYPLVMAWAWRARREARRLRAEGREREALVMLDKAKSAEERAWAMRAYCRGETQAPETRARYGDDEGPDESERTIRRAVLRKAAVKLHQASADTKEIEERLAVMDGLGRKRHRLRRLATQLRNVATEIDPRQGFERT